MNRTKTVIGFFLVLGVFCLATTVFADKASKNAGEEKFKALCTMCHPDGGNIVNPKKTLHAADRDANNVKTADDIIKIMRNPGPGMTKFDEKAVPKKEAQAIAEYILKTFK
jgi:cytochrome c6